MPPPLAVVAVHHLRDQSSSVLEPGLSRLRNGCSKIPGESDAAAAAGHVVVAMAVGQGQPGEQQVPEEGDFFSNVRLCDIFLVHLLYVNLLPCCRRSRSPHALQLHGGPHAEVSQPDLKIGELKTSPVFPLERTQYTSHPSLLASPSSLAPVTDNPVHFGIDVVLVVFEALVTIGRREDGTASLEQVDQSMPLRCNAC